MRDIMAKEEREKGDDELRTALRLSALSDEERDLQLALELSQEVTESSSDEALARALAAAEVDDDLAMAMALQEEEEVGRQRRERTRLAAVRTAAARHERVRVVAHLDETEDFSWENHHEDDEAEDAGTIDDILEKEGIVVDEGLRARGIIGRRADGSLVSKHDPSLDARLKAQVLQDTFAGNAGDIGNEKVPARVYNELVRKANTDAPSSSSASAKSATPTKQK